MAVGRPVPEGLGGLTMHMRRFAAVVAALLAMPALAVSPEDQRLIDQIMSADPIAVRDAAKSVQRAGTASPRVLDTMAEVLLTGADERDDAVYIDALAWTCKAIGSTGDRRYFEALKSVSQNRSAQRNLRKHCHAAASQLRSAEGEQYRAGMLYAKRPKAAPRASAARAAPVEPAPAAAPYEPPRAAGPASYRPITELKAGMSMEEALSIAGPPTSTGSHITGKGFIPFNFKGGDTRRTLGYYKGQGRVVYSNVSKWSSAQRVSEIQVDPDEPGYH
jgi:hypothetical protein